MVLPEARMASTTVATEVPRTCALLSFESLIYLSFLRNWANDDTNVQRTDTIIKTIASTYANNPTVVPVIAPLNELSE